MRAMTVGPATGIRASKLSFFYFTGRSCSTIVATALFLSWQLHAFAEEPALVPPSAAAKVSPVENRPSAPVIADLANHAAAVPAIKSMVAQGIMRGVSQTQFAPDAFYRAGDFAVSMQHMFNLPAPAQPIDFPDVPRGSPIYAAVQAIAPFLGRQLLCPGCALGSNFLPNQPVTRAATTVALVNILKAQGMVQLLSPAEAEIVLANVSDASPPSPMARAIFATALKSGIIALQPDSKINLALKHTRADAAVLLDALQKRFNIPQVRATP
jgi:hypothetical protein